MNSKKQTGFSHILVVVMILVVVIIGLLGYIFWQNFLQPNDDQRVTDTTSSNNKDTNTNTVATQEPMTYTVELEGLKFDYYPELTTLAAETENSPYGTTAKVTLTTGLVKVSIHAGISGIGGVPVCTAGAGRETCEVIARRDSTYLGAPKTYRLIKARVLPSCGSSDSPCETVPLVEKYILDTYEGDDYYGPCCSTLHSDSRIKLSADGSPVKGSLLVSVIPDQSITNSELFAHADMQNSLKIIESMRY